MTLVKYLKKIIFCCVVSIGINYTSATILDIPESVSETFPNIENNYSIINFDVQNNFDGVFLWRNNRILFTPVSITLWWVTISWCKQQLQWLYFNNQRGFRLRPIDQNTLAGMQTIDPDYNEMTLTGGLYTHCSTNPDYVYGAVGQIRGEHTYRIIWGVKYNLSEKTWLPLFAKTFYKLGSFASWTLFDSQWAIGHFGERAGNAVCGNRIIEEDEACDGGDQCTSSCTLKKTPERNTPIGKACSFYTDENYLDKWPFTDTLSHRGYPYIEVMRISCIHRGRGTSKWLWLYEPNNSMTRNEALKTVAKIVGSELGNLTVINEDAPFIGTKIFTDVPNDNWFAHYANYTYQEWLADGLYTTGTKDTLLLQPEKKITRYEAIKTIMIAYNKINDEQHIPSTPTAFTDVPEKNNPYYIYVRQAEDAWFIGWIPQANGSVKFEWQRNITRAEFAKITDIPFVEQLINVDAMVLNSDLYTTLMRSIEKTKSDKQIFVNGVFEALDALDDQQFIAQFKMQKTLFLETLRKFTTNYLMDQ